MRHDRRVTKPVAPKVDENEMGVGKGFFQGTGEREHAQSWSLHAMDEEYAIWGAGIVPRDRRKKLVVGGLAVTRAHVFGGWEKRAKG